MKTKKHRGKGGVPFTIRERSIIEIRWCQDNKDVDDIANELNRHRSSVYREIQGKPRKGMGKYDADRIQGEALDRIAKRGNVSKIKKNVILCNYIEEKMKIGWTPEQIHLRLPIDYPKDKTMCIATESIYQEGYRRVHRQGNGAIKKGETDLRPLLVRRHKRRMKKGFRKAQRIERNAVLPSIDTRPKVIEKRKQLGHWEDDCIVSRQSTGRIKSINERVSGVGLFGKMINGTIEESNRVVIERLSQLPIETRQTLTRDRGTENMGWK
ncbi:MAG: IS30 family transposase, partial [Nanoarchaeota archaeon]